MATRRTQPTSRRKPQNPIAIPGEKTVRKTSRSAPVMVKPARTPPDREPRPRGPAIDHRKQFSGTDEHATDKPQPRSAKMDR